MYPNTSLTFCSYVCYIEKQFLNDERGLTVSPVVKSLPSKAGDEGSFPAGEAKNPHCLMAKKSKHKAKAILQQIH